MKALKIIRRWVALLAVLGLVSTFGIQLSAAEAESHSPGVHSEAVAVHGGHDAEVKEVTLVQMFGYSYLTAYMFCLSLVAGSLVFVILHHLFNASWSAPVLRVAENLACLFYPWMLVLLLPILILQRSIYPWLSIDPAMDHALDVKKVLFNPISFNVLLVVIHLFWGWMAHSFRRFSLNQDRDGAAVWTHKSKFMAAWGIYSFAVTLTLVCFLLMKSLMHQFFSTMYGVYYFAGSFWTTLATLYAIAQWLSTRELKQVVLFRQIKDLGTLFFAFTVFYAYIHFSQYFLIWNAAIPEETFWYVKREQGSWWDVGLVILFGHFFVPFLLLLRIDAKMKLITMGPIVIWAWLMHYVDMTFNVMPVLYPSGLHVTLLDPICWLGMAAFLGMMWWKNFKSGAPWPLKHPRLAEAVTHHEVPKMGEVHSH
jgi:hypothetical protein